MKTFGEGMNPEAFRPFPGEAFAGPWRAAARVWQRLTVAMVAVVLTLGCASTLAAQTVPHFVAPDTFLTNATPASSPSMYWSAAGDFNGDGVTDLAAPDGRVFNNLLGFTIVFGQAGGGFSAPVSRSIGSYVKTLHAADFNHDAVSDLLLVTASGAAVMLGSRDGVLSGPAYLSLPLTPNDAAVADFTNDGNLDVVVAGDLGYTVAVGNGTGAFGFGRAYPEPFASFWVVTGDFNNDGAQDFMGTGSIGGDTFLGNGDGTFKAPIMSGVTPTWGTVAADFNRDGRLDLAMLTAQHRQDGSNFAVTIAMGWGDGTFGAYFSYVYALPLGGLVVGDFNEDGNPDVATYVSATGAIRVFAGDGRFGLTGDLIDRAFVSNAALLGADIDGNGSLDLVQSDFGQFKVFRSTHGAPPLVAAVTLNPPVVIGGTFTSGTVRLGGPAPAEGAVVALATSDPGLASIASGATVTIPAGLSSGTFDIATSAVAQGSSVAISAAWNGVTQTAPLGLVPSYVLTGVAINPARQYGIFTATGSVTLDHPADSNAVVTLASANPALASVPASIVVPAGATSASFPIALHAVDADTDVIISASRGDVTATATITVLKAADSVGVSRALLNQKTWELKLEASSTSAATTMTVHNAVTGALLGTLDNLGGGKYKGSVILFAPGNASPAITVKSALGGTVTTTVQVK